MNGFFAGYSGYLGNHAAVAVVPVTCTGKGAMDIVPNVTDSEISNNTIACLLYTPEKAASASSNTSLSSTCTVNAFSTSDLIKANLVCGEGFTANSGITIGDGTTDNNTYIAGTAN